MLDRTGKRLRFAQARVAEQGYARQLRSVAHQIGVIIRGMAPDGKPRNPQGLIDTLLSYAELITPWASSVASLMVADVARRDKAMWFRISKELSQELRREVTNAPTGAALRDLQQSQLGLIKSLPKSAAVRIQELTQEATLASIRPADIALKILETESVTKAKATLIARTEVSRAAANLVQARAQYAGSDGYIWRTSGDLDVRPSHREMEGKYVRWSSPPKTDKGLAPYHAGCGPNCRCFAEPIFPNFND